MEKQSFLKNHADTVAIIGVNIGIAAILISMCLSNTSNMITTNARIDTLHVMFYDLLRENKK